MHDHQGFYSAAGGAAEAAESDSIKLMDCSQIATTVVCAGVQLLVICLAAYGANKEYEPGDWKVWVFIVIMFVGASLWNKTN